MQSNRPAPVDTRSVSKGPGPGRLVMSLTQLVSTAKANLAPPSPRANRPSLPSPRANSTLHPELKKFDVMDDMASIKLQQSPKFKKKPPRGQVLWGKVNKYVNFPVGCFGANGYPTFTELQALPQEIIDTVYSIVYDFLYWLFYPVACLYAKKSSRRALMNKLLIQSQTLSSGPSLAVLQQNALFGSFENLNTLLSDLIPMAFEAGEIIIHQGDASRVGAFYIAQGTVDVYHKRKLEAKSIGFSNRVTIFSDAKSPLILGDFTILTEEPRLASVIASSRCLVYLLTKKNFFNCFNQQSREVQDKVWSVALGRRKDLMKQAYPMSTAKLRKVNLFSKWPEDLLMKLIENMQPLVIPTNGIICKMGEVADNLFYVANGKIGVYKPEPGGELQQVATISPGTVVGEMSLIFVQRRSATCKALRITDLFTLSKTTFNEVFMKNHHIRTQTIALASELQETWLARQRQNFFSYVRFIPFVNLAPEEAIHELATRFSPKVFLHNEAITSHAMLCDRLLIITHGEAFVSGHDHNLKVGECIGWTCLGSHRWEHLTVAHETVETIFLPYNIYKSWLKKHGLYQEVLTLTLSLLHPRVYSEHHGRAVELTRDLKNLPMNPVNPKPYFVRFATRISTESTQQKVVAVNDKVERHPGMILHRDENTRLNEKRVLPPISYKRINPDDRNVFTRLSDKKEAPPADWSNPILAPLLLFAAPEQRELLLKQNLPLLPTLQPLLEAKKAARGAFRRSKKDVSTQTDKSFLQTVRGLCSERRDVE